MSTSDPLGTDLSPDELKKICLPHSMQLSVLQVGQRIAILRKSPVTDVTDWSAAQILRIGDEKIEIKMRHFDNEPPDDDAEIPTYWIDPTLAHISTNESCVSYQDCTAFGYKCFPSNPCYANGQIIMSIDDDDDEEMDPGIYIYDISGDSVSKLCAWPEGMRFELHGIVADPINHDIYLISGSTRQFAVYNMVTKQWTKKSNAMMPALDYPSTIYAPEPVNELYFIGTDYEEGKSETKIMKWSKDSDSSIDIAYNFPTATSLQTRNNFVYDKDRNRILLFGGSIQKEYSQKSEYLDDIWSYCLNGKIWRKLTVKLPLKKYFWVVCGFASVVIALQRDIATKVTDIWCLDLNTLQWFKSHMRMPSEFNGDDLVATDDHFLHCFSYDGPAYHLRFDLRDMIPKELFAANLESNMQMISAYCWIMVKGDMTMLQVPDDVKYLIASFYNALY